MRPVTQCQDNSFLYSLKWKQLFQIQTGSDNDTYVFTLQSELTRYSIKSYRR